MSERSVIVDAISKSFGHVEAVRDVTFEVRQGEVVGLLGPNGAGKTTTVDILSTLTRPVSADRSCSPASRWPSTTCSPGTRTWQCSAAYKD